MVRLTEYEKTVITLLCESVLSADVLSDILESDRELEYDYTGAGYYISIYNDGLPKKGMVCYKPFVHGKNNFTGEIESGFMVLLGNNTLDLECYSLFEDIFPEDYRSQPVVIEASDKI